MYKLLLEGWLSSWQQEVLNLLIECDIIHPCSVGTDHGGNLDNESYIIYRRTDFAIFHTQRLPFSDQNKKITHVVLVQDC